MLFAAAHLATAAVFLSGRASGTSAAWTGFPLDDAWIHLVYSRSLSSFDGFAYNPGTAEAGFTSPLWVILLVPAFWFSRLGVPVVVTVKALGIATCWACSCLAFNLVRRLTALPGSALAAGMLIAVDPWLGFAKVSGMEVPLAAATVLFVLQASAAGQSTSVGLGLALAVLARPENSLFVVVSAPLLSQLAYRRSRHLGDTFRVLLPPVLAAVGWSLYCLASTGSVLPNTFYAKHPPMSPWLFFRNISLLGGMLVELPVMWGGAGPLLLAAGAYFLSRPPLRMDSPHVRAPALLLLVYPATFIGGLAWTHNIGETGAFSWHRYFEPAIPSLLVVVAVGMGLITGAVQSKLGPHARRWPRAAALGALLICGIPFMRIPGATMEKVRLFSKNCENINEMQVHMGQWVASNVPAGEWIATNDAGAIRFFGEHPVVDMVGLNSHEVLQHGMRAVVERKPTHYVIFEVRFPGFAQMRGIDRVHSVRAREYTICECPGQAEMIVLRPQPWLITALAGGAAAYR